MNVFRAQTLIKYQCSSVFLANELIWGMEMQVLGHLATYGDRKSVRGMQKIKTCF